MKGILIVLIFFVFSYASCNKGPKCEQSLNVNKSEIVTIFKDKTTGKYLYSEINPLYNKDSLKVFDASGNPLLILSLLRSAPDNSNLGIYILSFGNIYNSQTDAISFNTELCKNFIVKYSYNEIDTIQTCFKAKTTECGSVFETLKIYNKGQLIANATNETSVQVTILKN